VEYETHASGARGAASACPGSSGGRCTDDGRDHGEAGDHPKRPAGRALCRSALPNPSRPKGASTHLPRERRAARFGRARAQSTSMEGRSAQLAGARVRAVLGRSDGSRSFVLAWAGVPHARSGVRCLPCVSRSLLWPGILAPNVTVRADGAPRKPEEGVPLSRRGDLSRQQRAEFLLEEARPTRSRAAGPMNVAGPVAMRSSTPGAHAAAGIRSSRAGGAAGGVGAAAAATRHVRRKCSCSAFVGM